MELLVGDRDVVEHRLHVAGVREHIVVDLKQERGYADVFRPFLWRPRAESDARTQDESLFQVLDAIGRYSDGDAKDGIALLRESYDEVRAR